MRGITAPVPAAQRSMIEKRITSYASAYRKREMKLVGGRDFPFSALNVLDALSFSVSA